MSRWQATDGGTGVYWANIDVEATRPRYSFAHLLVADRLVLGKKRRLEVYTGWLRREAFGVTVLGVRMPIAVARPIDVVAFDPRTLDRLSYTRTLRALWSAVDAVERPKLDKRQVLALESLRKALGRALLSPTAPSWRGASALRHGLEVGRDATSNALVTLADSEVGPALRELVRAQELLLDRHGPIERGVSGACLGGFFGDVDELADAVERLLDRSRYDAKGRDGEASGG